MQLAVSSLMRPYFSIAEDNMENKLKEPGTCAYCGEQSDRLFEPPLLEPDSWSEIDYDIATGVLWHVPGSAYPGRGTFDVVVVGDTNYLRPYESPDQPICWLCFSGQLPPSWLHYCVNKPSQIRFNGYKQPEWIGT